MSKTFVTRALTAGLLASVLSSAAVLAAPFGGTAALGPDTTPLATPVQMHMGPQGGPMMMGLGREGRGGEERVDRVEGRIAFLKAELKITDAQAKQWERHATSGQHGYVGGRKGDDRFLGQCPVRSDDEPDIRVARHKPMNCAHAPNAIPACPPNPPQT